MPYSLEDKLVIGISSRALFDLDEANGVFESEGLAAYRSYQQKNEDVPLRPGTGFPLIRGLLAINERSPERLVEVIVISRNDADSGARIFNSIEHHKLDISRGAFTDGRDASVYLEPFHCDLFLSGKRQDVARALELGFPAALVLPPPESPADQSAVEVRVAFDGDAVLFDDASERVYQERGLEAFLEREKELANTPMSPGPFKSFLMGLKLVQSHFPEENSPIRTALVTARNAPAHKRVVNTLRSWGVRIDETFFLGGIDKARVLRVLRPHIYFDDQMAHLDGARAYAPSAHVIPIGSQIPLPIEEPEGSSDTRATRAGSGPTVGPDEFAERVIKRARESRGRSAVRPDQAEQSGDQQPQQA